MTPEPPRRRQSRHRQPPSPPAEGERPRDEHGASPGVPAEASRTAAAQPAAPPPAAEDGRQSPPSPLGRCARSSKQNGGTRRELEFASTTCISRCRRAAHAGAADSCLKQPQIPDAITDPEGYHSYVEQTFNGSCASRKRTSVPPGARARRRAFEQAYGEMIGRAERGDPSIVRAVMASPDPGVAMMNWYQSRSEASRSSATRSRRPGSAAARGAAAEGPEVRGLGARKDARRDCGCAAAAGSLRATAVQSSFRRRSTAWPHLHPCRRSTAT